jgi:hypothetical protein
MASIAHPMRMRSPITKLYQSNYQYSGLALSRYGITATIGSDLAFVWVKPWVGLDWLTDIEPMAMFD